MRASRSLAAAAVLGLTLGLGQVTACSVLLDATVQQCQQDSDCTALGSAFAGSHCSSDHRCVTTCAHQAECNPAGGEPSICSPFTQHCIPLKNAACPRILAEPSDLLDDTTVWFGVVAPISGSSQSAGLKNVNGVELARKDIRTATTGLPPLGAGKLPRPVAMVVCDEAANLDKVSQHLAEEVGVVGFVGPAFSSDLIYVGDNWTIPDNVIAVSGSATSTLVTHHSKMVWSAAAGDSIQVKAVAALVSAQETAMRAGGFTGQLKVAAVTKDDAYGTGFSGAFGAQLMFNSMTASKNGDYYIPIIYDHTLTAPQKSVVDKLVAASPDIIILVGTGEAVASVYSPVEAGLASGKHPQWILTDGLITPELVAAAGASADLRARTIGTVYGNPSRPQYASLADKYKATFLSDPTGLDPSTAGFYDATYMIFYAVAASGTGSLDAPTLSDNLHSYVVAQGLTAINVGPDNQSQALTLLPRPGISLHGASGDLQYAAGEYTSTGDYDIWCVSKSPVSGQPEIADTSVHYIAANGKLDGKPVCP